MKSAWCYFIKNSSSLTDRDFRDLARRGKVFELGERTLRSLSVDRNVRLSEIQREKAIADYYAYIKSAKKQGLKEGREEGRQEGLEEGMQRMQQQVALNLLKRKTDISFISEMTGLSVEEIKKLK